MDPGAPYDCLIVGAGPAGLTAGLYLRRFHRHIAIVDAGQARALRIPRSHNVPGFPQGIPGAELIARLRQQVQDAGGQVTPGRVEALVPQADGGFVVHLDAWESHARTVLLATGAVDVEPPVAGIDALRSRALLRQCPICDGWEFTGRRIGVVAMGAHGARECLFIRHFSEDVTFIPAPGGAALEPPLVAALRHDGVRLLHASLREVSAPAQGGVRATTDDGAVHAFDVLYAALGCHPRSQLAAALGLECDAGGNIVVDAHCRTRLPGLYAAGDVTGGLDQIVVAAGQAAVAATAIHNAL